jgi:hypothetical protein
MWVLSFDVTLEWIKVLCSDTEFGIKMALL